MVKMNGENEHNIRMGKIQNGKTVTDNESLNLKFGVYFIFTCNPLVKAGVVVGPLHLSVHPSATL